MKMKMKRKPCKLGWTDHAFRRLRLNFSKGIYTYKIKQRIKVKRFISTYNTILFRKPESNQMPF